MPRDLFGDVTHPSISVGNRKWYTVPVSLLSHSAIVFAIVVIPLLASDALPEPWEKITVVFDIPPVPTPPPAPRRLDEVRAADPSIPPREAPEGIAPEKPVDLDTSFQDKNQDGVVGGDPRFFDVVNELPPPPIVAKPTEPVRVGSGIRQPQRIRDVQPLYPQIAQAARVQGIVIIEATIGEDGQVINARVLRSVPLLDQAALDAVRQWQYTPTLLNGVPVPVIMSVTVQFTLSR